MGKLSVVVSPKESDSHSFSNHELLLAPLPRVGLPSRILTGLVVCRCYAEYHGFCELMCAAVMSCPEVCSAQLSSPSVTSSVLSGCSLTFPCTLDGSWRVNRDFQLNSYGFYTQHPDLSIGLHSLLCTAKSNFFKQGWEEHKSVGIKNI